MSLRYGEIPWDQARAGDGAAPQREARRIQRHQRWRNRLPVVKLHGVNLHAVTEHQCIRYILGELETGHGGVVITPNLDHLRRAATDLNFKALVYEADLVVADGMPVVWASRLQKNPLPQRVAGSDLIWSLSTAAADAGRSIYLLGGAPGTAESAAQILQQQNPRLRVAGTHCPPMGFENDESAMRQIVDQLTAAQPDIVYVALGSPKQESLIARIRQVLPAAWWLGVGVSFSFVTGDVQRAPAWMRRSGLEWVHRLIQEPGRLFKRYIVQGLPFAARLLGGAMVRGWTSRAPAAGASKPVSPAVSESSHSEQEGSRAGAASERAEQARRKPRAAHPGGNGDSSRLPKRLKGMIVLGGLVRPRPLSSSIGRSLLDLPLNSSGTILTQWLDAAAELARAIDVQSLPVRVLVDNFSPEPSSAAPRHQGSFRVERDASQYRGSGGVLGDLAGDYHDNDLLLVVNAAQILLEPLACVVQALDHRGGQVTVVAHEDGTPSGIMLVTCKALRVIPPSGFVDMKEQALPAIASEFDVRVLSRVRPSALPVRSPGDYIRGLREHLRNGNGPVHPLAEDWGPRFALVEDGAGVHATARVHDAVVLRGGTVEAGAVVVRSLVCPGGVVKAGRKALDALVADEQSRGRLGS